MPSGLNTTNCPGSNSCVVLIFTTDGSASSATASGYSTVINYLGWLGLHVLYKYWASGDGNPSVTVAGAYANDWICAAYSGISTSNVINQSGGTNYGNTSGTVQSNSIATTVTNTELLMYYESSTAQSTSPYFSSPSEGTIEAKGGGWSAGYYTALVDYAQAASGATGNQTIALQASSQWTALQLALAPASAGGPKGIVIIP